MKQNLVARWKKVPDTIRRPIVLTVGMLFVILSGALGWLPGPGGIPLFLLGIAILATEYHWAERLKQFILHYVYQAGRWIRAHKVLGTLFFVALAGIGFFIMYMLFYTK